MLNLVLVYIAHAVEINGTHYVQIDVTSHKSN